MRNFALIALLPALAACASTGDADIPAQQGVAAVHVPVVNRAQYVFDAPAPYGELASGDAARLDAWFNGLDLGYGDSIYLDGITGGEVRSSVARLAGKYGMLLSQGTPATPGSVGPGNVRVIVSRARADVPNCPDWSEPASPNYANRLLSNFGCGVNSALAMQVANPEDLVHGREGTGVGDAAAAAKAIEMYRNWPLTGVIDGQTQRPLKDASTRKKEGN